MEKGCAERPPFFCFISVRGMNLADIPPKLVRRWAFLLGHLLQFIGSKVHRSVSIGGIFCAYNFCNLLSWLRCKSCMKFRFFPLFLGSLLISCSASKEVAKTSSNSVSKTYPTHHTTRDYPYHETMDMSKLSIFEQALLNSWSEWTKEEKTFFKSCLIGN